MFDTNINSRAAKKLSTYRSLGTSNDAKQNPKRIGTVEFTSDNGKKLSQHASPLLRGIGIA